MVNASLAKCLDSVLKAKAKTFNQEKALVGAFTVIIVKADGSFAAPILDYLGGNFSCSHE